MMITDLANERLLSASRSQIKNFLLSYRTTPTTTTGQTPSELFLGRSLRTRADLIIPDLTDRMNLKNTQIKYHQNTLRAPIREFNSRESVLVKNHIGKPK